MTRTEMAARFASAMIVREFRLEAIPKMAVDLADALLEELETIDVDPPPELDFVGKEEDD